MKKANCIASVLTVSILFISTVGSIYAQDFSERELTAWTQLMTELASQGFDTSEVLGLDGMVDSDSSMLCSTDIKGGSFQDPYGTLRGCFIFAIQTTSSAVDTGNGRIVVFKDGRILWMSDPFSAGFGGKISALLDLNKDGIVDIVSQWIFGERQDEKQLWIHSWDGTLGRIINANLATESDIEAVWFELVDVNGDGVLDIQAHTGEYEPGGEGFQEGPVLTYTWNGKLYGQWNKHSIKRK